MYQQDFLLNYCPKLVGTPGTCSTWLFIICICILYLLSFSRYNFKFQVFGVGIPALAFRGRRIRLRGFFLRGEEDDNAGNIGCC